MDLPHIPPEVADQLGYYVYLYIDPRTNRPFYVGKGCGRRVLAHMQSTGETDKARVIAELSGCNMVPQIDILAHGLPTEEMALRIEAAVIDVLGLGALTNAVSGWRSVRYGRMPLEELITYYAAQPVTVSQPVLLIRVNRLYRHRMPAKDLYDATRGRWRVGSLRTKAELAFAVFEGVVREVYVIEEWHRAGTTTNESPLHAGPAASNRWEFTGRVAAAEVRKFYVGKSVAKYFSKGSRNPVAYVNC